MYNHNITVQEISDYNADMAEMNAINYIPTEEEVNEMYIDSLTNEHNGYWFNTGKRWEWLSNEDNKLRAYIEWDEESQSYQWINAEENHGECQYDANEINLAKIKAMEDWIHYHTEW